jgi:amino acid transporter
LSDVPGGARFKARAGLLSVMGLIYASGCGGPYGTEDYVGTTGPGLLLLLLLVTPWLWGVPMALATAELSSLRPVEGGYYRWVREIFGEYWGFQVGSWTIIASVLDNALYPVLFGKSLAYWIPDIPGWQQGLAAMGFILFLTFLNYRGIQIVGGTSVVLSLFLMAPLVWVTIAGLLNWHFNPLVPFRAPGIDGWEGFGSGLALAMWYYSGMSEISTAAEEIKRPERTIPRGLALVVPIIILSYAAPTVAGLASVGSWQTWSSGHFAVIGEILGGKSLGTWTFLGSVASYAVIFLAYLVWYPRLVWAMAEDRMLPRVLARLHPRHQTPYVALLAYGAIYCLLVWVPFEKLLVLDVWMTGAYSTATLALLARLRTRAAPETRGFRVPGGKVGAWLVVIVPAVTWVMVLCATAREHWIEGVSALLMGSLIYVIMTRIRRRSARALEAPTG